MWQALIKEIYIGLFLLILKLTLWGMCDYYHDFMDDENMYKGLTFPNSKSDEIPKV